MNHEKEHTAHEEYLKENDVPELPDLTPEPTPEPIEPADTLFRRFACAWYGHIVNEGLYTDSHGNEDSLSFCERCGEYDV